MTWKAFDEQTEGDNFHTSIYEDDYKGLLIARCNQNGQHPEQAAMIVAAGTGSNPATARDGIEAQHGLNDTYPGDPYP